MSTRRLLSSSPPNSSPLAHDPSFNNSSAALVNSFSSPPTRVGSPEAPFDSRPVSVASSMGSTSPFLSRRTRTMESTPTLKSSASEKYNLNPDFSYFLSPNHQEPDDQLHNPDRDSKGRIRRYEANGTVFTTRGVANLGCVVILIVLLVGLFLGYPLTVYFTRHNLTNLNGFNLGGINSSGQVPASKHFALIDPETPDEALTYTSYHDGQELQLVFSDEFNVENRTFFPGDDPYWEAVDLYYWQTLDREWYSPWAITTRDGSLQITFRSKQTHNLSFEGGMMTSWNKFCFTGGLIIASVRLPGRSDVSGFWPAVWTMGNLGRAGFGASLDGLWPYSYDACDIGTLRNQSIDGVTPIDAWVGGDHDHNGQLSALPGQRLSRCTCAGEDHPGPIHGEDGSFVGRASPEIDVLEAQVDGDFPGTGASSQSAQWAPFNAKYAAPVGVTTQQIFNSAVSQINTFTGSWVQQATSVVTNNNETGYELTGNTFQQYGFEYKPGYDDGYIAWMAGGQPSWTMHGATMAGDPLVNVSARAVSQEPMYILMNLGMSRGFAFLDFDHLVFPATMSIDYIRVYQPKNKINIGCDPPNFPTADYIQRHLPAYTNPNLTNWEPNYAWPKNKLIDTCSSS